MTKKLPKATHTGVLHIGDATVSCAVLEDGTRVLTRATFLKAIGRKGKAKGGRDYDDEFKTPVFLTANNLKPYINNDINENSTPIIFDLNGRQSIGYKAELLPQVCAVFIDADEAGVLQKNQYHIAQECKILFRGFATVGILALVDEATGYQEVRDRLALQKILEKYITDEWAKWTKTFPDEFYKELFRLKKMSYPPVSARRPSYIGHWTNDIVYDRLAPGVLNKLRDMNPTQDSGRRKRKHHQYLTADIGNPALKEHLSNVIFLMKSCSSWDDFKRRLNRAKPKFGDNLELPFDD